jgi:UTP-glucose-1-phosphate uridylyltransferase
MLPIGTKPAIQWAIEEVARVGITSAIVVINPEKHTLRRFLEGNLDTAYFGIDAVDRWISLLEKVSITIAVQPTPRGLGDALLRGWRAGEDDEFYLVYPDNVPIDPVAVFNSLEEPFRNSGKTCIAGKDDRPYYTGNNFLFFGSENNGAFKVSDVTSRTDNPPPKNSVVYRAAGRVMTGNDYFETLEQISTRGVKGELDDIHVYRELVEQDKLLAARPVCRFHDVGDPEGYKDAWLAYITGELEA